VTFPKSERPIVGWPALGKLGLLTLALAVDLVLWGFEPTLRSGRRISIAPVVASAIAVFGLLYFRSRWPRIAFAVAWTYCVLWGAMLPAYQPFTALLVALYHVARHLSPRESLGFLSLAVVPPLINTRDAAVLRNAETTEVVLIGLLWSVFFGIAWGAGRWGQRVAQATRWREEKLAAETSLALQNERLTLARELHDVVAHSVASITFQAAGARHAAEVDKSVAAQSLEVIEAAGVRTMQELRDLLGMLNSAADAGTEGGPTAHLGLDGIESLLDLTRQSGVSISLHRSGTPGRLTAAADHTAYRLVQESLTNAIKHSGQGLRVDVRISWRPDRVDIGVASSSESAAGNKTGGSGGYGLAGMRYRVASVGGVLESGWQSADRFCVSAQIPVDTVRFDDQLKTAPGGRSR
jgi:signal transduction histidine kinase